jgi:hypothetical protein
MRTYGQELKENVAVAWKRYLIAVEVNGHVRYWWKRYIHWSDKLKTYERFGQI